LDRSKQLSGSSDKLALFKVTILISDKPSSCFNSDDFCLPSIDKIFDFFARSTTDVIPFFPELCLEAEGDDEQKAPILFPLLLTKIIYPFT
jgi:hypothetical protein